MKTIVIRIGNSKGIRIPKAILEECRLEGAVELRVRKGRLLVSPVTSRRSGWEDAFRRMAAQKDDALLDRGTWPPTRWDRGEWEW